MSDDFLVKVFKPLIDTRYERGCKRQVTVIGKRKKVTHVYCTRFPGIRGSIGNGASQPMESGSTSVILERWDRTL